MTSSNPILIPQDAIKVENAYEEVFFLYTVGNPLEWEHNQVISQKKDYIGINQTTITIFQNQSELSKIGSTGSVLWDSSVLLLKFLIKHHDWLNFSIEKTKIIELGSGCGLIGIGVMPFVKIFMMTDQISMIKHIWKNVNYKNRIFAKELNWSTENEKLIDKEIINQNWNYVVSSDCIYNEFIVDSFVGMLIKLCKSKNHILTSPFFVDNDGGGSDDSDSNDGRNKKNNTTIVVISLKLRSDNVHLVFMEKFLESFVIWRMPNSMFGDEFRNGYVIYLAWLK
ncbi:9154_t:CDS:2 [Entrophospora sp. SA101]|nr:9432_t:CDS:2 [Entrophospora sp. SA101]CAJ0916697.1 9154_t:CDS:2 [Entrophospora sp. SA101]